MELSFPPPPTHYVSKGGGIQDRRRMKIHLKGRPKQYSFTKVTCHDSIVLEMLSCSPDSRILLSQFDLEKIRENKQSPFLYRFICGASLKVGDDNHEYYIYSMLPDGSDTLAAIEELKMLDSLRLAKKHFLNMKKACYNPQLEMMSLRVTQF